MFLDPFVVSTARNLPSAHPLHALLAPEHGLFTLRAALHEYDLLMREGLTDADRDRALEVALEAYERSNRGGSARIEATLAFAGALHRRGDGKTARALLEQIVEAHRYLESNQQVGKVVVTVS